MPLSADDSGILGRYSVLTGKELQTFGVIILYSRAVRACLTFKKTVTTSNTDAIT
jgi:hypothetical protein